jgi:hypothetical protein
MTARTGMRRRLLLLPLVILVFVGVANAASIGPVTSTRLSGFAGTGSSGAKTVYASDNFTGANNTNINGRALVLGQTWVVGAGTWRLTAANEVDVPDVNNGRIVTDTGQANVRIIVTVSDGGGGGRTSGVTIHSDLTATRYLSIRSQNGGGGRIILTKHDGGTTTTLLTHTGVALTNPAVWSVELNGASIAVSYNGVVEFTYMLTGTDLTTFGPFASHGLFSENAGTVRFDDFRVESL